MKRKNATRSALFTSIISLLLCVSMLVGTTFAWFTDSVTSGVNNIAAGNLDVELYHSKDKEVEITDKNEVGPETLLFTDVNGEVIEHWEPGVVAYTNLKVANVGTLALKYQMSVNSTEMNYYTDTDGVQHTLAEALKVAVVTDGVTGTREEVIAAASEWKALESFTLSGELEGNEISETYGIVIYWEPGDNDNLFNMNNGKETNDKKPLTITLGVNLFATQEMYEEDSFGEDYDAGAYLATVYTEAELISALNDNQSVKLGNNIVLTGEWTPIGDKDAGVYYTGTLDGQGYTISGLSITSGDYAALIGAAKDATIKNLTVEGAVFAENAAGIVARVEGATVIENVVNNVNVSGSSKAGGIACNVTNTNPEAAQFINCVNNGIVNGAGTNGLGGIIGYVNNDATVSIKSCTNNGAVNGSDAATQYAGAVIGYSAGTSAGTISNFTNTGKITGKFNTDTRYLKDAAGTYLAGYCATPDNWKVLVADENGLVYLYSGADVILYDASDYESNILNIPEGVTSIAGYAFAGNDAIEKIVLPSTVTTLADRAFRDTSASTVVLNEGLTNISYQAFRNASNVTAVVIPSTVTTISKEAFQKSGIKELVVPETVTTIEYGAMRDMEMLEKVTIASNADIPVYAFRACTNLKTVYLTGENVTFGGGSKGMIFTNKENGDGSAITIYVANETVKDRLIAADTAAKDYGGYKIVVAAPAEDSTDLNEVIANAKNGDTILLSSGNYVIPDSAQGKTLTIVGNGETVIATQDDGSYEGCDYSLDGATVTFENVVITTDGSTYTGYARLNATYNNCVINNTYTLYGDSTFNNCTFNVSGDAYNIWTWGAPTATFNNCTFNTSGKALLLYGGTNTVLTVNGCTFNDDDEYDNVNNKAAIEVGTDWSTDTKTVIVTNTTVNGFDITDKGLNTGTTLWGNKNSMPTTRLSVTVDGVNVREILYAANDTQLAAVVNALNTDSGYWNKAITVKLAGTEYTGDYIIKQYPEWNGEMGQSSNINGKADTANVTHLTFEGAEGTTFTGNVTVTGFGAASNGFTKAKATTAFKNITFNAANSVEANGKDYIVVYMNAAASGVTFDSCDFKDATHITIGGSGHNGIGAVTFTDCTFDNGNCLSGYCETLTVTDSTVADAYKGFISNQKAGTITVSNCDITCSDYAIRTQNSGISITVENSAISVTGSDDVDALVHFRGSNHTATFTGCSLIYEAQTKGVDTCTLTIN